jgi:hypothetical protein
MVEIVFSFFLVFFFIGNWILITGLQLGCGQVDYKILARLKWGCGPVDQKMLAVEMAIETRLPFFYGLEFLKN